MSAAGGDALQITLDGRTLRGDDSGGAGPPVLLLHGLTATRRYVVHGSRALERDGYRVIAYDSRGHGTSDPAPRSDAYAYGDLADDCLAVLDSLGIASAILIGHSMGGHLAARIAITAPERVNALVVGAPAHLGRPSAHPEKWDRLADGLLHGGPEGMWAAFEHDVPAEWEAKVETVVLQRLRRHRHPAAVADALRATPRSAAFDGLEALEAIRCPTLVVGSHDLLDAEHPLALAQEYRRRIPGAAFAIEDEGMAPLTWRGGALSKVILDFLHG